MGAEATCRVTFGKQTAAGKARLETDTLQFRGGDLKLTIPFKDMKKVSARDGRLTVTVGKHEASFELGVAAVKWADKILHPPSRLDKLGAKPDWIASAIGVDDQQFLKELQRAVSALSIGSATKDSDAIFFGATSAVQLKRLEALKRAIKPDGAIWIVRPKGRPEISERAVMEAGKAAGLVDVKVVSFSATHTAEKYVIPRAQRARYSS